MTSPGGTKPGGDSPDDSGVDGPGLLPGDDLRNELEAWDRTFDALHEDEGLKASLAALEASGVDPDEDVTGAIPLSGPVPQAMLSGRPTAKASPPPASPPRFVTPVPRPPKVIPAKEAPRTVFGRAPAPPPAKPAPARKLPGQPLADAETDFSDLGFDGPPEALGSLLGQPAPLPSLQEVSDNPMIEPVGFDDDEVFTSAVRPGATHMPGPEPEVDDSDDPFGGFGDDGFGPSQSDATRVAQVPAELLQADRSMDRGRGRPKPETGPDSFDGQDPSDDTFDKVNRTRVLSPDDGLLASVRAAEKPAVRGPSIVRRGAQSPVLAPSRGKRESEGEFGAESTRVADIREIEKLARGSDGGRVRAAPTGRGKRESEGDFGAESTRVADVREIERLAGRQDGLRGSFPFPAAAPPPLVEDDPYDDIEIGGDEDDVTGSTPSVAGKQLTRHVVRRPASELRPGENEIELDADEADPSSSASPTVSGDLEDSMSGFDEPPDRQASAVPAAVTVSPSMANVARISIAAVAPPPARVPAPANAFDDDDDDDIFGDLEATAAAPPTGPLRRPDPAPTAATPPRAETAPPAPPAPPTMTVAPDDAAPDDVGLELVLDESSIVLAESVARDPATLTRTRLRPRTAPPGPPPGARASTPALDAPALDAPQAVPDPVSASADGAFGETASGRTQIGLPPPPLARGRAPTRPPIAGATPAVTPTAPTAVAPPVGEAAAPEPAPAPPVVDPAPELPPPVFGDELPALDLEALQLPEQVDPLGTPGTGASDPLEDAARAILALERELELIDEPAQVVTLRIEAGRLYERLGDADRARASYESALLADPRASAALRGLRRIARGVGDLSDATRYLDAELDIAGPLERRALALHRVDLLMAAGEQDLARVAVGELLDQAGGDVRAQLAQLELAFLDGRADELGESLDKLAGVLADPSLRAAALVARGHLFERAGDRVRARQVFDAAVGSDAAARAPWFGGLRVAERADWGMVAGALAGGVADPAVSAALAVRSAQLLPAPAQAPADHPSRSAIVAAASVASADPLVQAAVAEDAITHGDPSPAALAIAEHGADPVLRRRVALWAAARMAPTSPDRGGAADPSLALYAAALAAEPTDDHAAAALTDRWLVAGDAGAAARLLATRAIEGAAGEHDRVRAAALFVAGGLADEAVALAGDPAAIASPAAADAWAEVLAAIGQPAAATGIYQQVAVREDAQIDPRLWAAKAAAALDRAADPEQPDTISAALLGWARVVDVEGDLERAHARAITLSTALGAALGDPQLVTESLARAQPSQPPAAAGSLVVLRARAAVGGEAPDWARADEILRELPGEDPRRLATQLTLAARAGRWGDAALALEEYATAVGPRVPLQAALARYRAAGLYLDKVDNPAQAVSLLAQLADDHPELGFVADLLGAARRRQGDAGPPSSRAGRSAVGTGADAFARLVRDGDQAAAQHDSVSALALYGKALEIRPQDPLAAEPLARVASAVREPGPIASLALADLRNAEDTGDNQALADAYEALGRIDRDLRDDPTSALIAFESAATAAPERHAVLRVLERAYAADGRWADLAQLRERQIAALPAPEPGTGDPHGGGDDAVALALDRAGLLEQLEASDDELRAAYQAVVDRAPRSRRALFHLESLVRRAGSSAELVVLEDAIAGYFTDPRTRSAFLTRGGETLTDLGRLDEAIAHFKAADALRGGYFAALEGWRDAALRGQLWIDFADAARREADVGVAHDAPQRARLYHLAGVALMDKALAGERAADCLRAALAADPRHVDAFIRLRLLLDEQGEHDALATLLEQRLEVEADAAEQIALHRAIAELARNMLEDRERAKRHYRAIAEASPTDQRAIAALSDIAWEQGAWAECAEALRQRVRLERDPEVLRNIFFRLGVIFAERLPDAHEALKAFQRVLSYEPDDEAALARMADLGIATGQWKMALGACERLVKNETVPARKVAHLHRVGTIFTEGFGDRRRAERAYQLAVDAAPDSDLALSALIKFYQDAGDTASIRVHLGLVATAMRQRIGSGQDGNAFKVIARIARARHDAGVPGQGAVTRAADDVARLLGADPGDALAVAPADLSALIRPEADELLWPPSVTSELRQMFLLLGDRVAKHVGIDLRPYGVTRGDRVRARDSAVAAAAQEVAESLGLGELDVYVSTRQPFAMVAEPTSPLSLVLGSQIADPNQLAAVRFGAAGALRLAHAQLAIPARLSVDELGVLVVALLRLFQPDLPYLAVDADQVIAQQQRLKRLIPTGLMNELRPFALGVSPAQFDHRQLAHDLELASMRAGLLAAGGAAAPLRVLLLRAGATELVQGMSVPIVRELVHYAVSDDFAALAALAGA